MAYNLFVQKNLKIFAFFYILIYYLPYFVLGKDSHILIHDNLDSVITWIKILIDNNALFDNPNRIIHNVFGGLSISSIYPYYDIPMIFFKIFGVFWGYLINKFIVSLIGFFGMYFLLKKHFISINNYPYIIVGSALCFAILPFWSFNASISGLPFLLFAFLNLRAGSVKFYNWLIIIIYPFYSYLVFSGIFIILILSIIFSFDLLVNKKFKKKFFVGLLILGLTYLISHLPLFINFFGENISHRFEFKSPEINFFKALKKSVGIFVFGQYHAPSLHRFILIPIFGFIIFYFRSLNRKVLLIILFIISSCFFYGFNSNAILKKILEDFLNIIPIQLQRFHCLNPLFWYILFPISLMKLSKIKNYGKTITILILIFQVLYITTNHELIVNQNKSNYSEFYDEEKFNEIKEFINKPLSSYKVISVGMHPAKAQYNGFFTLDGYFANYPLSYKHKFYKIIKKELERDPNIDSYFRDWGSKCYAFSTEIGIDFEKKIGKIQLLDFDYKYLHSMGGKYILSSIQINTSSTNHLKLLKGFSSKKSEPIYLYEIKL